MGEQHVQAEIGGTDLRVFMQHLLRDLRAFERMMAMGMFERGVSRIGAEQELFLVDRSMRPASRSLELLEHLQDPRFTTEIAAFNLEINTDPLLFEGRCLATLEKDLNEVVSRTREVGAELGITPVLIGILPTIRKSDLELANLTDRPRYAALNAALAKMRGGAFEFRIKGLDDLIIKHDNVLIEGCNTSFQVHLQVDMDDFASCYNIAQLIAAPVLAAGTNSPILFGRRLWRETRIALFQQAVDTRSSTDAIRERSPRVMFGTRWVDDSPLDLFRDDVTRFRVILGDEIDENPFEKLAAGEAPGLRALRLYNGTVYRWNRACYGITDGKPHIRIENRILPSGPTVIDEVSNAAFWLGLMKAGPEVFGDVRKRMMFDDARMNFVVAARLGLAAHFQWLDGESLPAQKLIIDRLLPIARRGLERARIAAEDIDKYLNVIAERVASARTGSAWTVVSYQGMLETPRSGQRLNALVAATIARQTEGKPVSQWELATIDESGGWLHNFSRVEQYMTTDLFTVQVDEPVDLVASIMDWRHIRHVPVEDNQGVLVGIVSYRALLRLIASGWRPGQEGTVPVAAIMQADPVAIPPETSTIDALHIMRQHGVSALPVVRDGTLIGIVSERDFMQVAGELLEARLRGEAENTEESRLAAEIAAELENEGSFEMEPELPFEPEPPGASEPEPEGPADPVSEAGAKAAPEKE